jgi:hypothetical protein
MRRNRFILLCHAEKLGMEAFKEHAWPRRRDSPPLRIYARYVALDNAGAIRWRSVGKPKCFYTDDSAQELSPGATR